MPISARAEEIVAALQEHPVLILAGETGSGKTTQIPKMCLAAGRGRLGRIACTQPRRVAALSISRRVAEELDVAWGHEVGCKIRFNDRTTPETVIKFLTDGMLLAEVQGDPLLREYDTVIIDEAHERSLNIDFLLGHLRTLRHRRPELKVVITSATIDTALFSRAFDDAPVITVEGRTYPVEVIHAPLDELGSDAAAGDEGPARAEALHYIDGAAEAVGRILRESTTGDILVFMPSERDIRETTDLLAGRRDARAGAAAPEIVPLFGRLSNAEQQRVFAPSQRRKVIVATNIAETSLTIPGIRFVVDTGLARLSRYAAQARTRRLPIEPVSRSSADQRKGRCGRVADGVCIRLYSEQDYLERPRFTPPEIQRANLADVILRMKAFGLGDIERFPFINQPAAPSIRAGYALLDELGAIERPAAAPRDGPGDGSPPGTSAAVAGGSRALTPLGRELARLPVDPTVGRMILQAREEKALREVLVIAAGLSIPDPRERPLDRQAQADAAHRRFAHPDSDFLTLLNLWESARGEFDTMSQARLRRFCRDHFLSYIRLREWRDVHAQLLDALGSRAELRLSSAFAGVKTDEPGATRFGTPPYRAIHRSILAGLLGNIAVRDEEHGGYKATHERRVSLFPGSALFVREESLRQKPAGGAPARARSPRWILAAEIVETSRLFARTCARLDPAWALELGAHLVRVAHSEPFWDAGQGRVLVKRRTRLHGLELESRAVGYGRVDPAAATEIFIREGLVNDTIAWPFDFLAHNRAVRAEVESLLTRTRDRGYLNLDEAVYHFYLTRLRPAGGAAGEGEAGAVSAVAELVDLVRDRRGREPRFLFMTADDLRDPAAPAPDAAAFPAGLPLSHRVLPLAYAYRPGEAEDGVTLEIGVREAEALTPAALDWAVPGHLEARVEHQLRALPKELRRTLVPLGDTARGLAARLAERDRLTGRRETLAEALAAELREQFRLAVDPAFWADRPPPGHLRVRVRVVDDAGRELAASRELAEIRTALQARTAAATEGAEPDSAAWRQARARWEKSDQTAWTFGEIPPQLEIANEAGVPVLAFPGLRAGVAGVSLRLFPAPALAEIASREGVAALLELNLRHDLGWLQRELRALRELGPLVATLAPLEVLQEDAFQSVRRRARDPARLRDAHGFTLNEAAFASALAAAREDLRGLAPRLTALLREILTLRQALLVHPQPYPGLGEEVAELVPADFLRRIPPDRLHHLPRYLKGMKLRADRWRTNPAKDAERAQILAPYVQRRATRRPDGDAFAWLVEELRVSLFAQELGTAEPVSTAKLDRLQEDAGRPATEKTETIVTRPLPPHAGKKIAPLKSLGALDKLFRP